MTEKLTIARPYAKAAFSYALANNCVSEWSLFLIKITEICKDKRVIEIINNPICAKNKISDFLMSFDFFDLNNTVIKDSAFNFIKLLAEYGRLGLLPEINDLYQGLKLKHESLAQASIISAVEISKEQQKKLQDSLEKKLKLKVNLDFSVDNDLIAGILVKTGDLVIDASVKGQLNKLLTKLAA